MALFKNAGKELKTIAELIAIVMIIVYMLVALAVGVAGIWYAVEEGMSGVAVLSIIAAIIIAMVGWIKSRLKVIELYAYGELVEKVVSIDKRMGGTGASNPNDDRDNKEPNDNDIISAVKRNLDGTWHCMFCNYKNPAEAKWCKKCSNQVKIEENVDIKELGEYKEKIENYLRSADEYAKISDMLEDWNALELQGYYVVEQIREQLVEADEEERVNGISYERVKNTVESITQYYLKAAFRKEI